MGRNGLRTRAKKGKALFTFSRLPTFPDLFFYPPPSSFFLDSSFQLKFSICFSIINQVIFFIFRKPCSKMVIFICDSCLAKRAQREVFPVYLCVCIHPADVVPSFSCQFWRNESFFFYLVDALIRAFKKNNDQSSIDLMLRTSIIKTKNLNFAGWWLR